MKRRFARGSLQSLAVAALLTGCSTFVSKHPMFAPADFERSDSILGRYTTQQDGPDSASYYVDRSGDAGLRIVGIMEHNSDKLQVFYGEGAAVPLGSGDYVLQMSCVVYRDDAVSPWTAGQLGPPGTSERRYTQYGVAMKDRKADSYWILADSDRVGDDDKALFSRYGIEEREIAFGKGKGKDKDKDKESDTVDVLPAGMSADASRAFFREVVAEKMAAKGAAPDLMEQQHSGPNDYSQSPDLVKAMTVTTADQCRTIMETGPRNGK